MPTKRLTTWEAGLSRTLGAQADWTCYCYDQVSSTMDVARDLIPTLTSDSPSVVLARKQSAGRGRRGNAWEATPGAFFATYIFSYAAPLPSVGSVALVAGCTLAQTLSACACDVKLKWPNDILSSSGQKLGGILLEQVERKGLNFVLIGIGLNLLSAPAHLPEASSVFELSGQKHKVVDLAAKVSPALYKAWQVFLQDGFTSFKADWTECALYLGKRLEVDTGSARLKGVFSGVNDKGHLQLDVEGQQITILSGHVTSVEAD
ncbi:biotin--[acetyl-CoA-carboxylase] ligase [Oligoflexia bacterium]|nr:biotin--[acetyl-CoA-carboxylase] ligase [Oligoflexia bacterium]